MAAAADAAAAGAASAAAAAALGLGEESEEELIDAHDPLMDEEAIEELRFEFRRGGLRSGLIQRCKRGAYLQIHLRPARGQARGCLQ
jgi:hypothetical protein